MSPDCIQEFTLLTGPHCRRGPLWLAEASGSQPQCLTVIGLSQLERSPSPCQRQALEQPQDWNPASQTKWEACQRLHAREYLPSSFLSTTHGAADHRRLPLTLRGDTTNTPPMAEQREATPGARFVQLLNNPILNHPLCGLLLWDNHSRMVHTITGFCCQQLEVSHWLTQWTSSLQMCPPDPLLPWRPQGCLGEQPPFLH